MKKNRIVDEAMRKFVETSNGDVNKDLAKLDLNRHTERTQTKRPKFYAWAAIAMTCVVIIVLAIALPLTIGRENNEEQEIFYSYTDVGDEIIAYEELSEYFSDIVYMPQVSNVIGRGAWIYIAEEKQIGFGYQIAIYDDVFYDINGIILYHNVDIIQMHRYLQLSQKCRWQGLDIEFETSAPDEETTQYLIRFRFEKYDYYLTVETLQPIPIEELMDKLYIK